MVLPEFFQLWHTSPDLRHHIAKVMAAHQNTDPLANGLLDYNRLENR